MTGSPKEVGRKLDKLNADQIVAFPLTHSTARQVKALAETIANIIQLLELRQRQYEHESLEVLVDAFMPKERRTLT